MSVSAVRTIDAQGVATTLPASAWRLEARREPALLILAGPLAQPGRTRNGIEIDLVAGYGTAASDCPEPLRQAVRLLLGHAYEQRGLTERHPKEPAEIADLIAPYRPFRIGGRR
jgi:uncharacterized phiE125 gp8 family phage protein